MGMGMKNTTAMRIRLDVTQPDDSAWNKRDKVYIAVEEVGGEGGGAGTGGRQPREIYTKASRRERIERGARNRDAADTD